MSTIEQWVEQFRGFGAHPSPEHYTALFDLEGTIFNSGMESSLSKIRSSYADKNEEV